MIKDFSNLHGILNQAQKIQKKLELLQREVGKKTIEVSTGGGIVTILINGNQEILSLKIDKEVLAQDYDMVKDLIISAINEAIKKSKDLASEEMKRLTGDFDIDKFKNFLK